MNKDLKALPNYRWEKAFHKAPGQNSEVTVNRKAMLVIEHMI
jgi:hypothetical protein